MKIAILDIYAANPGDIDMSVWNDLPAEVVVYDRTAPEEVLERAADSEIIITNKVVMTRELMAQLPKLKYIGVTATGFNIVDIEAAREMGITVTNIPAYSTMSVAQMVFAHILNVYNNVGAHADAVRGGRWQACEDFCFWLTSQEELAGRTLGVVGLGNTGLQTARIALAFGMKVIALTSKSDDQLVALLHAPEAVSKAANVDDVFRHADIVSLHCPLTPETKHIVNEHTLSLMAPTAILVNTGRGPLVDENALAAALTAGKIQCACLDVLSEEAPRHGSPLLSLANCHITPHIAWATTAARHRLLDITLANVRAFLAGAPQNVVS